MAFKRSTSGGGGHGLRNFILIALGVVVAIGGFIWARDAGYIKGKPKVAGITGQGSQIEGISLVKVVGLVEQPLPSTESAVIRPGQPCPTTAVMEWNAQIAQIGSNGGPRTTNGSAMGQHGACMNNLTQNDTEVAKEEFLKFAEKFKANKAEETDVHFFQIMGDGLPFHAATLVSKLQGIDKSYQLVAFYSPGRSYGEDKAIGLIDYKRDPNKARGQFAVDYPRDGDWNLRVDWQNKNGICNNSNPETYMRECVNQIEAKDFMDAVRIFLAGQPDKDRRVVDLQGNYVKNTDGSNMTTKTLGISVVPTILSTWTPGDEEVFVRMQKTDFRYGKLSVLSSTKLGEQSGQMPNLLVGLKQWADSNPQWVDAFIDSSSDTAIQVRSFPKWLDYSGEVSAKVYNSHTGEYWVKYFKGFLHKTAQGENVLLGGSAVHTVLDNAQMFGLDEQGNERVPLSASQFGGVYRTFSRILVENYPHKGYQVPPLEKVIDLSHLKRALQRNGGKGQALITQVNYDQDAVRTVGKADYKIEFDLGKASIRPSSYALLDKVRDAALASDQKFAIYGHADAIGDENANVDLSRRRADAVKAYIRRVSPTAFPDDRFEIQGYGSSRPLQGRDARNCPECRRVEIQFRAVQ